MQRQLRELSSVSKAHTVMCSLLLSGRMVHVSVSEANQHKHKIKESQNDELLIYSPVFCSGFTEENKKKSFIYALSAILTAF